MARDDLQWLVLNDFSPGIFGDIHGGVGAASRGSVIKNGAATIDGTFRCGADAFGALTPLPAAATSMSSVLIPGGNANGTSAYYPSTMIAAYLVDAATIGPYSATFTWPATLKNLDAQVVHATCWFMLYAPAGGSTAYRAMYLCRLFWAGGTKDILWDSSYPITYGAGFPHQIGAMSVTPHRTGSTIASDGTPSNPHSGVTVTLGGDVDHDAVAWIIPADEQALTTWPADMFDRLSAPRNTYPGINIDVAAASSADNGYMVHWPRLMNGAVESIQTRDFTETIFTVKEASQTNAFGQYGSSVRPQQVVSHQGRVVSIMHRFKAMSNVHKILTSYMAYSPAFLVGTVINNATFYGENNSNVMMVASMNTDELLMIRDADGGLLLRGDIDNPTVVRLRNLESMYGITMTPINTPNGLVYGTPNGVFVYAGGEVARKISEQLEGFFWDHRTSSTEPDYEANRARFGHFHHYVAVANNFLYDERGKGWWRLSDPADRGGIAYNCYTSDPTSGNLYAFPYKLTSTQNVVCDVYTKETLASSYSWQSHPLVETLDRVESFRELRLVASPGTSTATGTIVVTLTGYDDDGVPQAPVVTTFQFVGDGTGSPVIQRKILSPNFRAMYVRVKIEASVATGPAPKVVSLQLGHLDRAHKPYN